MPRDNVFEVEVVNVPDPIILQEFDWGDPVHITDYEETEDQVYEIEYDQGVPEVGHDDLGVKLYWTEDDANNDENEITDHAILDFITVSAIDETHVSLTIHWESINLDELFEDHQLQRMGNEFKLYARLVATQGA